MEQSNSENAVPLSDSTARRELLAKFGRYAALAPTAMILLSSESEAGDRKKPQMKHLKKVRKQKWHRGKGSEYH